MDAPPEPDGPPGPMFSASSLQGVPRPVRPSSSDDDHEVTL
jgi:hypothetical protein